MTCRVDPPFAHLRVEDDGNGVASARAGSEDVDLGKATVHLRSLERSVQVFNQIGGVLRRRVHVVDIGLSKRRGSEGTQDDRKERPS